jgi:hypothetical protein
MNRTFYPSDEYDSRDLEWETKRRLRSWHGKHWRRNDDDDDPPPTPAMSSRPRPLRPPLDAAAQAA